MTLKRLLMTMAAILAVVLFTAGTASADTIFYTASYGPQNTELNGVALSLQQWDPTAFPGFTLDSVQIAYTVSENVGNITLTNTASEEEDFTLNLTSTVTTGGVGTTDPPTALSPDPIVLTLWTSPSIALGPGTTTPIACTVTQGGTPAGCNQTSFNPGAVNGSSSVTITNPSLFSPYMGSNSFTLTTNTLSGESFSGGGANIQLGISDQATVSATVTYDYDNSSTPEPASMFLSGGALLALGALLRKRKQA